MKSIQSKILFVVISGLLVITAAVSLIAVSMTHEIMHKDADRILNNVALKEAALLNDTLDDMTRSAAIMEHYARTEAQSLSSLQDPENLTRYLERTKKMFSEIALNTKNISGFYLRLDPELTASDAGFYSLMKNGTVTDMPLTDLSAYPENDTQNLGWYYRPIQAGKPLWLEPYRYPHYDTQLITYALPLYLDNQVLGVLGFDMNLSYLLQQVKNISVYETGYALLLSTDGTRAYNTAPQTQNSDPYAKSTARLLNGMYLELRADYKDIQRDIRPMMTYIVLAFLCVLALSILYTILVTRRIVRPLKQLTRSAQQLTAGAELSELSQVPTNAHDEIGTLSQVLLDTYAQIREYTTYINALAYRDSLTGIKNSTAYTEAITELDKEINRSQPRFGVLVVDINNLKLTNDTYGHDIGNNLIVHTARILSDTFQNSPVFRIGGDEFAVVLQNSDYENYRELLEQLDAACARDHICADSRELPVSIARGVALYDPKIDHVYGDVFAKADHAMYLHKQSAKLPL